MQSIARNARQIGAVINRERRARGLTQAQLGVKIGKRQATISKLEKGESGTQLNTLLDVLSALNLELVIARRSTAPKQTIESIF